MKHVVRVCVCMHARPAQVLVFSQFVIMLNIIADFCTNEKHMFEVIDGRTKSVRSIMRARWIADT
jgi:SNF2 family DNA or RNA helicase